MGKVRKRKGHRYPFRSRTPPDRENNEQLSAVEAEMQRLGFPISFHSTNGEHIQGQPNVEAARIGQIRRYQQFQGKKLKEWQIRRLKGIRLKQARAKAAAKKKQE